MKKIFTTLLGVALGFTAMAQVRIGVEGGATYNMMSQRIEGVDREVDNQFGYRAGVNLDFGIASNLSIQTGVFLNANVGSKSFFNDRTYLGSGIPVQLTDNRQYKITQLQIPAYIVYRTGDDQYNDPKVTFGVGPYIGFNLGGNFNQRYIRTTNGEDRMQRIDRSLAVGTGFHDDVSYIDFGAAAMIGFELPMGIYIRGQFNYGLLDQYANKIGDNSFKVMSGGLSVGFNLFRSENYYR